MRLQLATVRMATVLTVAGTLMAVPAAAGEQPVLWSGEVRNAAAVPVAAEVIAYLRPPVEALEPGVLLLPIARTTTDAAGRFTLRAAPSEEILAIADPWVTVMVVAYAADGMSVAVDSVAWRSGGWITRPGDLEPGGVEVRGFPEEERPPVLVIQAPRPGTALRTAIPPPAGFCAVMHEQDVGSAFVTVGELHLNAGWGGEFVYSNTKSTSFQVGWRPEGKGWSGGGSYSKSYSTSAESGGEIPADQGQSRMFTYSVRTLFRQYTWRCKGHDAEHTDSWGNVDTVEPTGWTGGVHEEPGGPEPSCPNSEYADPVAAGRYFSRGEGSSITFGGGINIIGFSGAVTAAISKSVKYKWKNALAVERYLCGESDYLTGNTRVRSLV